MCAKHIITAGIKKLIFLEPYPKSLAADLHGDAIAIEGADRGQYERFPSMEYIHFYGVSPRRYREMFERGSRKDKDSKFEPWKDGVKRPIIDIKIPFYTQLEEKIVQTFVASYLARIKMSTELLGEDTHPGIAAGKVS